MTWTELADKLEQARADIAALVAIFNAMEERDCADKDDEDSQFWRAHGAIADIAESFTGRWT